MIKGRFDKNSAREAGKKSRRGKSEKTKQWEMLRDDIIGQHTERFNDTLTNLPDDKFINAYLQVLEYFKPKLSRTEINPESGLSINIKSTEFTKNDSDR